MAVTSRDVGVARGTTADVDYKIAATLDERADAFRLVYRSYLEAGLGQRNPYGMRVTPYHLLPTTEVFIATLQDEVILTVSLVTDGEAGLPMECVYEEEVAAKRAVGLRLGEVSCLADRRSHFRGFFPVFLRLSRLVVQYARHRGLDQLLLAVHPKHARFYQRFMTFRPMGAERVYPTVRNHPAVALCLDFARVDAERHENYETFIGAPLPEEMLRPRPITPAEVDFFRPMIDPTFKLAPLPTETCFRQREVKEASSAA